MVEIEEVRGRPAELFLGPELDRRLAEMEIAVEQQHMLRAGAIGLADDCARDLGMLDQPGDDDVLAFLDVRAHANSELSVAPQTFFGAQGINRPSRSPAAGPSTASRRARHLRHSRPSPGPRESLGAHRLGRLAVHRLLDAGLLLALEERVILERIAVQVRLERHRSRELGVAFLEVEVLPDRRSEEGLRLDSWFFEIRHSVL